MLDEHGAPLEPPIALIEPQAYAARAKRDIARLFAHAGEDASAHGRWPPRPPRSSARLERFWLPDRRFYSLALDGDGRASAALASNQGHALWAAAVSPERARAVRNALMSEDLFSGWGIRTLGRHEARLQPRRLPPRHGVAARQRAVRRGTAPLRLRRRLRDDLRGAARGRLARRRLPPARAVRRLLAHRVRDARALSRRLPPAGVGRGRDPVPADRAASACTPPALEQHAAHPAAVAARAGSTASRSSELCVGDARVDLLFERAGAASRSPTRTSTATATSCSKSRRSWWGSLSRRL